ncbi:MAG: hypothetical protein QM775_36985 [Pirellulales bacterium]
MKKMVASQISMRRRPKRSDRLPPKKRTEGGAERQCRGDDALGEIAQPQTALVDRMGHERQCARDHAGVVAEEQTSQSGDQRERRDP